MATSQAHPHLTRPRPAERGDSPGRHYHQSALYHRQGRRASAAPPACFRRARSMKSIRTGTPSSGPAERIDDIEKVETVFKGGVGFDPERLTQSVAGLVGLR